MDRPNILNGGTSAKAIGTSSRTTGPSRSSAIFAICSSTDSAGHSDHRHRHELLAVPADQFVPQREIADGDLRSRVDDRIERKAGGLHFGQDQLAPMAPGDHHDLAGHALERARARPRLDEALFEIHHQPLLDQSIDADHALAADVRLRASAGSCRLRTVLGPERELVDLHPVDDVARGHAVEDRRSAERKLQVRARCAGRRPTCRRRCRR